MNSSPRRRALDDVLVAAVTLGLCMLLFPGAFLHGEIFFERDLNFDWYLRLHSFVRALAAGSWPVWDPGLGFGQPLLADPGTEVLYPFTWVAALLPRNVGYTFFVVAHLVLTAVGMARLARALGAGRVGAPLAALAWVLSGPLQSSVSLRQHLAGLAWMPWVLLGVERATRAPSRRAAAALAAVAALQVLAGSADVCAMTWAMGACFLAFRLARGIGWWRPSRTVLAAALLCIGITAAAWWPALDVLSRSPRRDLPADIRGAWSVPVPGLLRLVVPLDPGRVSFSPERWLALYDRVSSPFLPSLYLGLTTVALAGVGLLRRRGRARSVLLGGMGLVALALALGPHAPLYPAACAVFPPLRIFRYPSKTTWILALVVALLAGLGAGRLARRGFARRAAGVAGLLLVGGVAAAEAIGRSLWSTAIPAMVPIVAAVAVAVLLAAATGRVRPALAAVAVAALAVSELGLAHAGLNPTAPPGLLFHPPPVVDLVDRSDGHRLYVYDYHSLAGTAERLLGRSDAYLHVATPPGWDERRFQVLVRQLYLPPPAGALFDLPGSFDFDVRGLYSRDLNDLVFFLRRVEGTPALATLLRMGAVGTVLSLHRAGLTGLVLERELPSLFPDPILVWRVPGALPRARVVGGVRVGDGAAAFRALLDPAFDPARTVLLPVGAPRDPPPGEAGHCRLVRRAPDRVVLEVLAAVPAHVVLADTYDPGWRATVDGHAATVERADVAFRAVAVPAGRHVVEMVYRPASVARGMIVSMAAGLALLAGVTISRRRPAPTGR